MMDAIARRFSSARYLWITGVAYVLLSLCFVAAMLLWNFVIIDEMFVKEEILARLAEMDASQKRAHAITTATLDVAYPFVYGTFQAGMAYRFLGPWGKWIALLSLLCIPVDLVEGVAQVMLLNGHMQFVDLKVFATPIKLGLYIPGLCAALVALFLAARHSGLIGRKMT